MVAVTGGWIASTSAFAMSTGWGGVVVYAAKSAAARLVALIDGNAAATATAVWRIVSAVVNGAACSVCATSVAVMAGVAVNAATSALAISDELSGIVP